MVTNLVKNASEAISSLKAAADGRDPAAQNEEVIKLPEDYRGAIEVSLYTRNGRAIIEVRDNGIGLPKQNRDRLVEPYVTNREKGTGLGLAIVHKICEQHGGILELEDAPSADKYQRGALVRISLPLPEMHEAGEAFDKDSKQHDQSAHPSGGKRNGDKSRNKSKADAHPLAEIIRD